MMHWVGSKEGTRKRAETGGCSNRSRRVGHQLDPDAEVAGIVAVACVVLELLGALLEEPGQLLPQRRRRQRPLHLPHASSEQRAGADQSIDRPTKETIGAGSGRKGSGGWCNYIVCHKTKGYTKLRSPFYDRGNFIKFKDFTSIRYKLRSPSFLNQNVALRLSCLIFFEK